MIAQLKAIVDLPIRNTLPVFVESLEKEGGGQNMDFGAGSQTLLTRTQLFVKF